MAEHLTTDPSKLAFMDQNNMQPFRRLGSKYQIKPPIGDLANKLSGCPDVALASLPTWQSAESPLLSNRYTRRTPHYIQTYAHDLLDDCPHQSRFYRATDHPV